MNFDDDERNMHLMYALDDAGNRVYTLKVRNSIVWAAHSD